MDADYSVVSAFIGYTIPDSDGNSKIQFGHLLTVLLSINLSLFVVAMIRWWYKFTMCHIDNLCSMSPFDSDMEKIFSGEMLYVYRSLNPILLTMFFVLSSLTLMLLNIVVILLSQSMSLTVFVVVLVVISAFLISIKIRDKKKKILMVENRLSGQE